jgi:hypothetical protein
MPPPWSPKIYIEKDTFIRGSPLGESTTFYIKAKVEKYADYNQADGLVLKYTLFEVPLLRSRTTRNFASKKSGISTSTVLINSNADIGTPTNSRVLSTTALGSCPTGSR